MADEDSPLGTWEQAVRDHEARLTVGTRVRVIRGECRPGSHCNHLGALERTEGTIREVMEWAYPDHDQHSYLVGDEQSDRPDTGFGWFAASELRPIEEDDIINVRDFGATGDGSDDTEAINAARTEAARRRS